MLARGEVSEPSRSVEVGTFLEAAAATFRNPAKLDGSTLSFGIDLGTATIVLTAIDQWRRPIYWDSVPCEAVRDGVVVNFADAVAAVRHLKTAATAALGRDISSAATASPPGVPSSDARACRYVLENAELSCRALVDEVSAAQALLQIEQGAIVDVGGGSTGVGIVQDGFIIALDDQPGGGHHLDLILAGALRISVEDAERRKREGNQDYSHILRPGVERIASSILRQIGNHQVRTIHLVGGAVRVPHASSIVAGYCGIQALAYPHSELVTPFGIAMSE